MRLLIDLQGAQTESRFRGIGRYSMSLAQAMARNAGSNDVWVAVNGTLADGISEIREGFDGLISQDRIRVFESLPDVGWPDPANAWRRGAAERIRESFLAGLQPDVIHVSSLFEGSQDAAVTSIGRHVHNVPTAVTLYDLIPLLNQDKYLTSDWTRQWYMDKVRSLERSTLLLSISEYARSEALQALSIDPARVINMSSAISPHFKPQSIGVTERDLLRSRFGIRSAYVMYSGAMESRKNADGLLQAFAMLDEKIRASTQLVIAGKVAPHDMERFVALAGNLRVTPQVIFTGYISDQELILLYSAAAVYVFPSLHEGFGLPALEAMACGAPTIGSATTSVPEVIGRQDALFDPTNPEAIAASIKRVLCDEEFSASLREHAPRQAARFSWDASAQTALTAFERIVQGKSSNASWPAAHKHLDHGYRALIDDLGTMSEDMEPPFRDLAKAATAIARNSEGNEHVARAGVLPDKLRWRVEGPFDSSYSLALVNRELALALFARGHEVVLHSTEGPGDFDANVDFLAARPEVASLHTQVSAMPAIEADITSRLMYPPRVADMVSRQNLLHLYAWEESGFPQDWVNNFNTHLQGISCVSEHVRKVLIDNGVAIPISVRGNGVDHWLRVDEDNSYPLDARQFRFIHVSSCFPRKGADVLLKAFGEAFTSRDDVSLVIKTFANPHNHVHDWLKEARYGRDDFPHVVIIEDDLSDAELKGLYSKCHALVAPSRAEGFGLPLAEAMLSGLQVITTGWSGQLDFCNDQTAWLVDFDFAQAQSHFNLPLSVWAEPKLESLVSAMKDVFNASVEVRMDKIKAGHSLLERKYKWSDIARHVESDARDFALSPGLVLPRIGWVTTWNTRCGVATYSSNLIAGYDAPVSIFAAQAQDRTFDDEPNVDRCWEQGDADNLENLSLRIDAFNLKVLVIQFQYSFFDFTALDIFIRRQKEAGRTVILMMHATIDSPQNPRKRLGRLAGALALCDRVLVHSIDDLNRLKRLDVIDNVTLFPHGIMDAIDPPQRPVPNRWVIASYGFFLPHKGLVELIEAMAILRQRGRDVQLTMFNAEYPVPESRAHIELAHTVIGRLGLEKHVTLVSEFLRDEQSMQGLVDTDLIVFPYQGTGESSSAAVRHGLASGRPVAVTPLSIFDDVGAAVHRLPGTTPQQMADGLGALLDEIGSNAESMHATSMAAQTWRDTHRCSTLSRRLGSMISQLQPNADHPSNIPGTEKLRHT